MAAYRIGAIAILAGMWVLAAILWRAWSEVESLPMHWSLTGRVTWSAPRLVALAVLPGSALLIYLALWLGRTPARHGFAVVAMMASIDLLHLFLAGRSLEAGPGSACRPGSSC